MLAAPIVVLASGDGSLAEALIRAGQAGCDYFVVALITDRDGINALNRAARLDVPTVVVNFKAYANRPDWEAELISKVAGFNPWLVVSAGFMRILSPEFLARFKMINTHPALLPLFPGAHPVADTLAAGATETGCTVHFADAGVDTGPIIAQRKIAILDGDDEASLHERIKEVERVFLPEVVADLARAREKK